MCLKMLLNHSRALKDSQEIPTRRWLCSASESLRSRLPFTGGLQSSETMRNCTTRWGTFRNSIRSLLRRCSENVYYKLWHFTTSSTQGGVTKLSYMQPSYQAWRGKTFMFHYQGGSSRAKVSLPDLDRTHVHHSYTSFIRDYSTLTTESLMIIWGNIT